MFYDNLKNLCNQRGVKVTNVITSLGISQGSMSHWKSGGVPNAKTLKMFSDYFGVPVDALIYGDGAASNHCRCFGCQKRNDRADSFPAG